MDTAEATAAWELRLGAEPTVVPHGLRLTRGDLVRVIASDDPERLLAAARVTLGRIDRLAETRSVYGWMARLATRAAR